MAKKEKQNLINILDNRRLFGIDNPRDIRRLRETASDIYQMQRTLDVLPDHLPEIIKKDLNQFYICDSEKEKLTVILEKDDWKEEIIFQQDKDNWLTCTAMAKHMHVHHNSIKLLAKYSSQRAKEQARNPDLDTYVIKKKGHQGQTHPYLMNKRYLSEIKQDAFHTRYNFIFCNGALKKMGIPIDKINQFEFYLEDRLDKQEQDSKLDVFVLKEKVMKRHFRPYLISKNHLLSIKDDFELWQQERALEQAEWLSCFGALKEMNLSTNKMKFFVEYCEKRFQRQSENTDLDEYILKRGERGNRYPYLVSKRHLSGIKEDVLIFQKSNREVSNQWLTPRELCREIGWSKRYVPIVLEYAAIYFERQKLDPDLPIHVLNKKKTARQRQEYSFNKVCVPEIKKGIEELKASRKKKWLTINVALQEMGIGANAKNREIFAQYAKERLAEQEANKELDVYISGERAQAKQKHPYSVSSEYLEEIRQDLADKGIFPLKKEKGQLTPLEVLYVLGYADTRDNRETIQGFIKEQFLENNSIILERMSCHNKVLCVDEANLMKMDQLIKDKEVNLQPTARPYKRLTRIANFGI